jgi:hypothetical protein
MADQAGGQRGQGGPTVARYRELRKIMSILS